MCKQWWVGRRVLFSFGAFAQERPISEYPGWDAAQKYHGHSLGYAYGYHFTPLADGKITELGGYFDGSARVSLWQYGGSRLRDTTITSSDAWVYKAISPVTVRANRKYTVGVELTHDMGGVMVWGINRADGFPFSMPGGKIRVDAYVEGRSGTDPVGDEPVSK